MRRSVICVESQFRGNQLGFDPATPATAEARLLAIFDVLGEWFGREDYEGCLFVNSLLESRDRTDAIGAAAVTALANVRAFVRRLLEEAGVRDPDGLALQWQTLMLGSIVAASAGERKAAQSARDAASRLLAPELPAH